MTGDIKRAVDDLEEALEEDERAALIADLRRCGFVDDAEEWLGFA